MLRVYIKNYNGTKISHEQCLVNDKEKKDYGFISKWRIKQDSLSDKTAWGLLIQRYNGQVGKHPGPVYSQIHREREWLYDFSIDGIKITGTASAMNIAIKIFINLIKERDNLKEMDHVSS